MVEFSQRLGFWHSPTQTHTCTHTPKDCTCVWSAGNLLPNQKRTREKCRLLATTECCTRPPHTHISTCIHACSYTGVCVCVSVPESKQADVSCLRFLDVMWLRMILRLFQDFAEAIPLMVESCIRFISRHGELSFTTEVVPEAFACSVAWQSRPVSWDPRLIIKAEHFGHNIEICLWFFIYFLCVSCLSGCAISLCLKKKCICVFRPAAWRHLQSVGFPGGGQWHQERLWKRWNWNTDDKGFAFSTVLSSFPSDVILHLSVGEDPLAGDQNDHDMDSIAGVLKLYFRGLDQALFPKEVFHDLISCVCKFLILPPLFSLLTLCLCLCVCVSNESSHLLWRVCSSDGEPPGASRSHQKGPPVSAKQNPHHHEIPVRLPPPVSHVPPKHNLHVCCIFLFDDLKKKIFHLLLRSNIMFHLHDIGQHVQ